MPFGVGVTVARSLNNRGGRAGMPAWFDPPGYRVAKPSISFIPEIRRHSIDQLLDHAQTISSCPAGSRTSFSSRTVSLVLSNRSLTIFSALPWTIFSRLVRGTIP